ncbi:hypothetical protein [Streptomyces sp. NPDC002250]|uniref:hypothetical protein n=1 Tax=Streptomyces sp. NPDC002250 TaxID=3364641 RepID=UPI003689455B
MSEPRIDEWVGRTKSAERYQPLWESVRAREALGNPVSYVVMTGKHVMQTSTDIELARLFAEHQYSDQDEVGEFEWVPDEHMSHLQHLRYRNVHTGEWESTINSISTVPALPEVSR